MDLVHVDSGVGRLIVSDIAINNILFRVVVVYAPIDQAEGVLFFRHLGTFQVNLYRLVLVGGIPFWRWGASDKPLVDRSLVDLIEEISLVDRCPVD